MKTTKVKCEWCGTDLDDEERESPMTNDGDDVGIICDECFRDHYQFTCDRCCEHEYTKYQHAWIVIAEEGIRFFSGKKVDPGVYELIGAPYYGGPMIGEGWLFDEALRKTPAKVDWQRDSYSPCGHLCRDCARELKLRHSKAGREFQKARREKSCE